MKSVTRAVQDEVWSQSLSRSSREIYAEDRKKQREASRSWTPDTLEIMAKRIKERESVGHNYLWGRQALEMIDKNLLDESDLDPHRNAYARLLRHTYSEPAAEAMLKRLIDQHDKLKSDVTSQK
jgi:hypothetical protein